MIGRAIDGQRVSARGYPNRTGRPVPGSQGGVL